VEYVVGPETVSGFLSVRKRLIAPGCYTSPNLQSKCDQTKDRERSKKQGCRFDSKDKCLHRVGACRDRPGEQGLPNTNLMKNTGFSETSPYRSSGTRMLNLRPRFPNS